MVSGRCKGGGRRAWVGCFWERKFGERLDRVFDKRDNFVLTWPAAYLSINCWNSPFWKKKKFHKTFYLTGKRISGSLEHIEISMPWRDEGNFVFIKANFAVECGLFGEKFNAEKIKLPHRRPAIEISTCS